MLDDLCEKDQRTLSGQITWLVKQEVERRREEEAAETPTA